MLCLIINFPTLSWHFSSRRQIFVKSQYILLDQLKLKKWLHPPSAFCRSLPSHLPTHNFTNRFPLLHPSMWKFTPRPPPLTHTSHFTSHPCWIYANMWQFFSNVILSLSQNLKNLRQQAKNSFSPQQRRFDAVAQPCWISWGFLFIKLTYSFSVDGFPAHRHRHQGGGSNKSQKSPSVTFRILDRNLLTYCFLRHWSPNQIKYLFFPCHSK